MNYKKVLSLEFLKKELIENKKNVRDISKEVGCSTATVYKYIYYYNIDNPNLARNVLNKEILEEEYVNKKLTVREISDKYDVNSSSVHRLIKQYKLKRPVHKNRKLIISENDLYQEFIIKQRNHGDIAEDLKITKEWVGQLIKRYNFLKSVKRVGYYQEISGYYWNSIIRGAIERELELDIDREYIWNLFIEQNRKCALTGEILHFKKFGSDERTASLDRKDSTIGYIKGNLQWVHKKVNLIKRDVFENEFIEWCEKIVSHKKALDNQQSSDIIEDERNPQG